MRKTDTLPLLTITIAGKKLANGNTGQTKHWSSSHKERKEWMRAIRDADVEDADGWVAPPCEYVDQYGTLDIPVGIEIQRCLGPRERHWDADSVLRGNAKQLIDSLVELQFIHDDSVKYLPWAIGTQSEARHSVSHVVVKFWSTV